MQRTMRKRRTGRKVDRRDNSVPDVKQITRPRTDQPLIAAPTKIRRMAPYSVVIPSTSTPTLGAIIFRLSDIPGYNEFTVAYDQYRITGIVVRWICDTPHALPYTAATNRPYVLTAVDYDDGTAPTSLTELYEYSTCDVHMYHQSFNVPLRPKAAQAMYTGAAFTGYGQANPDMWLDCASAGIEHYGLKYALNTTTASNLAGWLVVWAAEIEFRYNR